MPQFQPSQFRTMIAFFGGAFDPPHLGHREAIEGLLRNPGVRAVRVLPSATPVLKTAQTSTEHRRAMAELAFADLAEIDAREMRRSPGTPSYTFDTLTELRTELGSSLAFVVGVDQVEQFDRWSRFPEVLGLANWIALEREPGGADRMEKALARLARLGALESTPDPRVWRPRLPGVQTVIYRVPTPAAAMSSTEIRRDFARGSNLAEETRLAPGIRAYIRKNGLYGVDPIPDFAS